MDTLSQATQYKQVFAKIVFDANTKNVILNSVIPFKPKDITVSVGVAEVIISGFYGDEIAEDHQFTVTANNQLVTYTSYSKLVSSIYDNIVSFIPDPSHEKTFVYNFKVTDTSGMEKNESYSQYVHLDPSKWNQLLQNLMSREKNASSD